MAASPHRDTSIPYSFSFSASWADALLGLGIGMAGGMIFSGVLQISLLHGAMLGGGFGLVFGLFFSKRALSAGAGLIWGLSAALLLWFLLIAEMSTLSRIRDSAKMLEQARDHFPELVACLVCLGMPTGLALGIRGGMRGSRERAPFRWGRAIVAGGLAGIVSGMIFGYWMLVGGFFPLIAGIDIQSQVNKVALQFGVALIMGMTFGLLFQRDVRGYGSCMGWGLGYAVLWWFVGPLTLFPLSKGEALNWSVDGASTLFGALVGHILYGLILGMVYATFDRVWVRLFIQSDPLNREPEGPGLRLFLSLQWGAQAGIAGGVISSPFMIATGVLSRVAGVETHLSMSTGLLVHLLISLFIGTSYGLLFRDEASNLGMAVGWGWLFGLIWWYIGPLTLLPLTIAGEIDWRVSAASALLPSLLGHLIYGASTAVVFYILERRYTDRHIVDPRMAARELRRLRPVGTPAPALWFLALGLGLAIPSLLA